MVRKFPPVRRLMPYPKKPPGKAEIATLEPFQGLALGDIHVVKDAAASELALNELLAAGEIGFDTESKPTFFKGQVSEGPHVLQFATPSRAYIFQSHVAEAIPALIEILKSEQLVKIGFGLKGDFTQISRRFGLRPASVVDLDRSFRSLGYNSAVGAKSAIAILFNRRFPKSKSVTMSNWALPVLSDTQLLYAANDAYAAIRVHHALREQKD